MLNLLGSLIFIAPLTAALVIAVGMLAGRFVHETSERTVMGISTLAALISVFITVGLYIYSIVSPTALPATVTLLNWLDSGKLVMTISMSLDKLALGIGSLFTLLLFVTMRFSNHYLHRERGFARFFFVYALFFVAMLLIVLSGNGFTAFLGWELVGLSSYLLIAYAYERPAATVNATRVFITNRLGDAGFILALVLSFYWLGATDWPAFNQAMLELSALQRGLIVGGFALAAMVKSAQFPFSAWITRALEGPTPSSAIFYGSLMVHAGIFLLLRIAPAVDASPALQTVLLISGALTVLYGWLGGLVQTDVKTAMIFSTLTQTGLMLVSIGLGWHEVATVHLVAHAIWRAYQMLSAPSYLHLISRAARPVPKWFNRCPRLFNAALQRFWLDHIVDWFAVRPTTLLSQDLNQFDERVVNRIAGLPGQIDSISSLSEWEERKHGLVNPETSVVKGRGLLGGLLERVASFLYWFEETLVLKGSGDGLINVLHDIGHYLIRIEYLLGRPRYLWLIILLTLLVVF